MCKLGVVKLKVRWCAANCFYFNNGGRKRGFCKNKKKNRIDKHNDIEDDTNIQISQWNIIKGQRSTKQLFCFFSSGLLAAGLVSVAVLLLSSYRTCAM